jgi:hypothetical protein
MPGWPLNSRWIVPALVAQSLLISSTEYVRSVPVTLVAHIYRGTADHYFRRKVVQPNAGSPQPCNGSTN